MSNCVSRDDVLDMLNQIDISVYDGDGFQKEEWVAFAKNLPSVEPERPHGYWIWNKRTGDYECSECGCNPVYEGRTPDVSEIDKYKYCRWCGAKMEAEK